MSGVDLIIANCSDSDKARTNLVYLHPDTLRLFNTDKVTLSFGEWVAVYRAGGDVTLQTTEIGTNSLCRAALHLTESNIMDRTKLRVSAYKPKHPALCQLNVEVNIFGKTQITVDSTQVEEHFFERFPDETFSPGQGFVSKMGNVWLRLTVQTLKIPDPAAPSGARLVRAGEINKNTELILTPSVSNKRLIWKEAKRKNIRGIGPNFDGESFGVGGLNSQFSQIFRRAFASRLLPADQVKKLGIKHVKGMLLYGPPGTGKTLIARTIGGMLTERQPKVVNGPEILNKYVGASEEAIRALFEEARADQDENGDDSDLHIIIFDEIDSICKARGSVGGGTGVHDTVVNQLLSMIDGVDSLNNILVIGMTNRKDLIDPALLRSGRLEVHLEIGLPDEQGREQIFRIHTKKMKDNGILSSDISLKELAMRTKNYSGAEIEALVNNAASYSYYSKLDASDIKNLSKNLRDLKVSMEHFEMALEEIKPEFGVAEEALGGRLERGFHSYGQEFEDLVRTGSDLLAQVKNPANRTRRISLLLEGPIGCGKTALACQLALKADFPFVKLLSAEDMVAYADHTKALKINQTFEDAYKSEKSIVILDDIERLLGYTPVGSRFSTRVMEVLQVLCRKDPPLGRSIVIIATSTSEVISDLYLRDVFDVVREVPLVREPGQIKSVMKSLDCDVDATNLELISTSFTKEVGIKNLLMIIENAQDANGTITHSSFVQAMQLFGYVPA